MSTTTISVPTTASNASTRRVPSGLAVFGTLARRRLALSARTPREVLVPLLTPVLFALVIAPALGSIGPQVPGLDYLSFAAVGTAGLLIPLNCLFAGIGVILDREGGARRDLLAAPIARPLIVAANLGVALLITALQLIVLIAAAVLRGAHLHVSASGWRGSPAPPSRWSSSCTAWPRRWRIGFRRSRSSPVPCPP